MAHPQLPPPGHYRPGPSAWTRWLAVLLLLVAGALVWVVLRQRSGGGESGPRHEPTEPRTVAPRGDLAEDEKSTIALFENVSKSVVHITALNRRESRFSMNPVEERQGTGSGFLWDDSGHVVTNFHVTAAGNTFEITLSDGKTMCHGGVVGKAPEKDIAVIQLDDDCPKDKLVPILVGSSANLRVGQKVFAIGNPFGLDQTLTTGVISGLGREIKAMTGAPISDVIQTDAAINPGNSGGPLLDSAGRLIGINTAIFSMTGSSAGIGFAVPVDTVNMIVPQLISKGMVSRPGLGIEPLADSLAQSRGLPPGVVVLRVGPGSAAERAGLIGVKRGPSGGWIVGDLIIQFEQTNIATLADLYRQLDKHKVGDTVTITVRNAGQERKVKVTLQELSQVQ